MNIEMVDANPPTNKAAIENFEREFGLALPAAYKQFLLETNGGTPRTRLFPVRDRPFSPVEGVHNFLGLGIRDFPTLDLSYPLRLYAGGLPSGVIPIANEDTGSYICLDTRTGQAAVKFWDKRHYWSTGEWREQDFYHLADSFEEFLDLLKEAPD